MNVAAVEVVNDNAVVNVVVVVNDAAVVNVVVSDVAVAV